MLVITRKRNQAIIVGDGIEIRVLRIGRDGVRLGVTAPSDVRVHRQEIYEMVCAANISAAVTRPAAVEQAARKLRNRLRPAPASAPETSAERALARSAEAAAGREGGNLPAPNRTAPQPLD